jgi:FtsZ-binding cell division protein ZapB
MDWTEEEVSDAVNRTKGLPYSLAGITVRAIMTRAVELVAARGGTMTAEDVRTTLINLGHGMGKPKTAGLLGDHITVQGATAATLQAENERMKALLGNFDKRCADALADEIAVLVRSRVIDARSPAADALLDYRNPPSTERADRLVTLQAKVAELERAGSDARAERDAAREDVTALRAEVERLKAENATMDQRWMRAVGDRDALGVRLQVAESRLAAIREDLTARRLEVNGARQRADMQRRRAEASEARGRTLKEQFLAMVGKTAHNASAEANTKRDAAASGAGPSSALALQAERAAGVADGATTALRHFEGILEALEGDAPQEGKEPVPQCGAAHPADPETFCADDRGHDGPHSDTGDGPAITWRQRDGERYPCSTTCTHDDAATPGHPERVKERSAELEAVARGEGQTKAESAAYDAGVDAMRAACIEAVLKRLYHHGLYHFTHDFKAAIEGAAP